MKKEKEEVYYLKVNHARAVRLLYYFDFIKKTEWTAWENGKKWCEKYHKEMEKEIINILKNFG
jgi:hypothetical protein